MAQTNKTPFKECSKTALSKYNGGGNFLPADGTKLSKPRFGEATYIDQNGEGHDYPAVMFEGFAEPIALKTFCAKEVSSKDGNVTIKPDGVGAGWQWREVSIETIVDAIEAIFADGKKHEFHTRRAAVNYGYGRPVGHVSTAWIV